jgi:thioredoxin 1
MNKAIYFRGDQCSVCSVLYPKVKSHIEDHYPLLDFQTIEGKELTEMAAQYGVYTAPVLLIFFDGKEQSRFVRNFSGRDIDDKIERVYDIMFG